MDISPRPPTVSPRPLGCDRHPDTAQECLGLVVPAAVFRRVMVTLHGQKLSERGDTMTTNNGIASNEATEVIKAARRRTRFAVS